MTGVNDFLYFVFRHLEHDNFALDYFRSQEHVTSNRASLALNFIDKYIQRKFENEEVLIDYDFEGRIGPKIVTFDVLSHYGLFVISPDRLSLNSQRNFSTIRANTGVFKGKWMYELQLGSKGVMQVGWSTLQCVFNDEAGVGDTINSYAYDGNRTKKWNVSTFRYGEAWLAGDIIGCALDADEGTVDFYRNGKSLGRAFEHLSLGSGVVYFPSVSLAFAEHLRANFGVTPLRYPVEGYSPLQVAPWNDLKKSENLINWFSNLMELLEINWRSKERIFLKDDTSMTTQTFLMCLARIIIRNLGPLLTIPYVVEALFVPFLRELSAWSKVGLNSKVLICLDLLWAFLEEHELKICLESISMHLLSVFRYISTVLDYPDQCQSLTLLTSLCKHTATRQYLLQNVLFSTVEFINFVYVKPLGEDGLAEVVDKVWWETSPVDPEIEANKKQYMSACDRIKASISEIEGLQVEFLVTLLDNSDGTDTLPSSRAIFLRHFRRYVQESLLTSRSDFLQSSTMAQTAPPITLCCFHRLLVTFRVLWDNEIGTNFVSIPCRVFYDDSINYSGIDRLGGVLSHLQKSFKSDLVRLLGPDHKVLKTLDQSQDSSNASDSGGRQMDAAIVPTLTRIINFNQVSSIRPILLERLSYLTYNRDDKTPLAPGPADPALSLIELLDGVILFYHATARKQIAKIATLRKVMSEYAVAMSETKTRLERAKKQSRSAEQDLRDSGEIFKVKLVELARHMAWVRAFVFSKEKHMQLVWLLKVITATLRSASDEGAIFGFVPDIYLEALTDLSVGIKNHVHPTSPIESIPGHHELFVDIAHFLCDHFMDPRIVVVTAKDTLTLVLAGFVSNPITLKALESVPFDSCMKMVGNLLKPYENKAWAQSNFILVRFWQGEGFAFRYEESPHLARKIGPKMMHQESLRPLKPYPSSIFQMYVQIVMMNNPQSTTHFLDSLLNQLNWAFSEFIGMIQEIHNVSSRPERVFIDSRQLKVCSTCFNLTISLLRVLEMIVTIVPDVFVDPALASGNILARLCQLICQILNRVSSKNSCFQHVVMLNISDLEAIDHFPILAAVIGILLTLLKHDISRQKAGTNDIDDVPKVTRTLLMEPSFQISSIQYVLDDDAEPEPKTSNFKPFSFLNYKGDVSDEEVSRVEEMIVYLEKCQRKLPESSTNCDDENVCTICYAYPIAVTFKPCNHQSCQACIDRYLLISHDCFFCKATIDQVIDLAGVVLHYFSQDSSRSAVS